MTLAIVALIYFRMLSARVARDCVPSAEIALRCQVVRVCKVPGSVSAVSPSGFAAEIDHAPEAFFELLVDLGLG